MLAPSHTLIILAMIEKTIGLKSALNVKAVLAVADVKDAANDASNILDEMPPR